MENIWNRKCQPPPVCTFKSNRSINVRNLQSSCKELVESMKKSEALCTEAALLSRMIYRTKNKLRFDKGFQNMRKVNRCLQRYFDMDIVRTLRLFVSCLPTKANSYFYLPSRQMLQHILVQVMGLTRLLHQTVCFSKAAGVSCIQRINLGHSWSVAALFLGMASRIWLICQQKVQLLCKNYQELLAFIPQLQASDVNWLPQNFHFPQVLSQWLDVEETPPSKISSSIPLISDRIFNLLADDEDGELLMFEVDAPVADKLTSSSDSGERTMSASPTYENKNQEDIGESVALSTENDVKTSSLSSDVQLQISSISSLEELLNFTRKEVPRAKNISLKKQLKSILGRAKESEKAGNQKLTKKFVQKAKRLLLANL